MGFFRVIYYSLFVFKIINNIKNKIKIAGAGGISEKEKLKKEIKQLQEKLEELDSKLDNGEISETIWEK